MEIISSGGGEMGTLWGVSCAAHDAAVAAAVEATRSALDGETLPWAVLEVLELRGGFSKRPLQRQTSVRVGYA
ncbi:MAG: hypothetical protein R3325_10255 [Thermoanaerobaculia bacterium]|nr:hypothetical protein [Thermoanaerobaculia bacterium]